MYSCSLAIKHVPGLYNIVEFKLPYRQFSMWTTFFIFFFYGDIAFNISFQVIQCYSLYWQVLLVLSDGLDDSLEDLRKAATAFRLKGITALPWCSGLLLPWSPMYFSDTIHFLNNMTYCTQSYEEVTGRVCASPCEPSMFMMFRIIVCSRAFTVFHL